MSEVKSLPLSELTRAQITPPNLLRGKEFDDKSILSIILGFLVGNPKYVQTTVNGLEKYTMNEILRKWEEFIKQSIEITEIHDLMPNKVKFSIEEDFEILNYLKNNNNIKDFHDLIAKCPSIYPHRSIEEIKQHVEYIKSLSDEQKMSIYQQMAKIILNEKLMAESTNSNDISRASLHQYIEEPLIVQNDETLTKEINSLQESISIYADLSFTKNEIAMLRTESLKFTFTKSRNIIGKSFDNHLVDVDLNLFGTNLSNISRIQAVISLLEDMNFYFENVGSGITRVNGKVIPKGKVCILRDGYLIDINTNLFLFFINKNAVRAIENEYSKRAIKLK